jgi:hypothetical protein
MAYTTTQLAALQSALASGATSVAFEGRTVTYRSVADLKSAIAEVEAALARTAGTRKRRVLFASSKGY